MSPEPENGPNFRYRHSEAIEDLGGRPLARPYGAVDRPVRDGRRLGPGPVNAPERLVEQPPIAREDPRREMRHRTAARPFLLPPGRLEDCPASLGGVESIESLRD